MSVRALRQSSAGRPHGGAAAWLLALAAAVSPLQSANAAEPAPLALNEVAPGVFVHAGRLEDWLPENGGDVANLGFVVGQRCVAVIDTGGTPDQGRALRAAIARTTPLPVCFVINTHAHPDHVLGNEAFNHEKPPASFVANQKLKPALAARAPYFRNALQRDFSIELPAEGIVYPTQPVERTLTLDLGGRTLKLDAWPTAHTDNDLTVYDPQTRTLFLSDLLFVRHLPVLDGKLLGWLAVMDDLARLDVAVAVPGHGAVSRDAPAALAALAAQRRYLERLRDDTRAALKGGWTLPQAVERIRPDPSTDWLLVERFHRRNVTSAYAELEWE